MASRAEEALDLFARLMPDALQAARNRVLAQTPPELQTIMQRLVRAAYPGPGSLTPGLTSSPEPSPDPAFAEAGAEGS